MQQSRVCGSGRSCTRAALFRGSFCVEKPQLHGTVCFCERRRSRSRRPSRPWDPRTGPARAVRGQRRAAQRAPAPLPSCLSLAGAARPLRLARPSPAQKCLPTAQRWGLTRAPPPSGPADQYDYVFEDQIEFIVDQYLAGDRVVGAAGGVFLRLGQPSHASQWEAGRAHWAGGRAGRGAAWAALAGRLVEVAIHPSGRKIFRWLHGALALACSVIE